MRTIRFAILLLSFVLSGAPVFASVPYLVEDINPRFESGGSAPRGFVSIGGRVIFLTGSGSLWTTSGVPGDPVELAPTAPRLFSGLALAGGRAFFTACGPGGQEDCGLWASDGTPGGTGRLVRFHSASFSPLLAARPEGLPRTLLIADAGSGPALWATEGTPAGTKKVGTAASQPRGLVGFGGKGWFVGDVPSAVGALFSTDGRPGGTRRIGTPTLVSRLTPLGARLLFFSGQELWATDGTAPGTARLAVFPGAGNDFPQEMVVAGGRAFFFRFNGDQSELWTTDGTAPGTRRLISTKGGADLAVLGGKVAFFATDAAGMELWSSDGTPAGTRRVKDICVGACSGAGRLGVSALGRVWFSGVANGRGLELWTSDLSAAGTRPLRDLCPGSCSSDPRGWFSSANRVYFVTDVPGGASLIYASDGTGAGTRAIASYPGFLERLSAATLSGDSIVFAAGDRAHGVEPWVSNATVAGTRLLADLDSDNLIGSDPNLISVVGTRAFFFADDGSHGRELWSSDGTSEGTRLIYDFEPGPASNRISDFFTGEAGGRLVLFVNRLDFEPFELFGSDGTSAGTELLLPAGASADGQHVGAGGKMFFVAQDSAHGRELWATDGTPAGTLRLTDLVPSAPFRPGIGVPALLALGDLVVAPVITPLGGEELWISDGTVGGTRPLDEIYPFLKAPLALAKSPIAKLGGRSWFVAANPGDVVATLWRTDLSAAGTAPVGPLDLSSTSFGTWSLFPLGARLLVFGPSTSLGAALWMSDGTAGNTHVVGSVEPSRNLSPVAFAGRLWFSDTSGFLWTTDGTAAGTLQAIDAEGDSIQVAALAVFGDRLAITAFNGVYESDGTPAGTRRIELPGPMSISSIHALAVGDRFFFPWNDSVHGPELWALRPE
ncbi:MAG TPA: hypothetical protein VN851_09575 [Thermoanaerobaculia bacterium]|nr:hypothetical protein [Thermoanaerobaculia bacterium]